jgi:hypothetical protein
MAIELFNPNWVGADLFCDGLGEYGECVLGDDGPSMITDIAPTADDARRLMLHAADHSGWKFDIQSQRWLCPDCMAARDAKASRG